MMNASSKYYLQRRFQFRLISKSRVTLGTSKFLWVLVHILAFKVDYIFFQCQTLFPVCLASVCHGEEQNQLSAQFCGRLFLIPYYFTSIDQFFPVHTFYILVPLPLSTFHPLYFSHNVTTFPHVCIWLSFSKSYGIECIIFISIQSSSFFDPLLLSP